MQRSWFLTRQKLLQWNTVEENSLFNPSLTKRRKLKFFFFHTSLGCLEMGKVKSMTKFN